MPIQAKPYQADPVELPSGKILVTGGAGHVGANLVRRLLEDGHELRCTAHPKHNNRGLEGLPVEVLEGQLEDPEFVDEAIQGCERIFHVAAKVSTLNSSHEEEREIFASNVLATRNIVQSALRNQVEKLVLTGSFSAVGYDPDRPSGPSNESMPFYPYHQVLPYARSKVLAEHEVLKGVAEGLNAVIATSCGVVGPNDFIPSRLGRTLCDFAAGKVRAYIPGGIDFVAVEDLVQGHLLAMQKGVSGQKYIFSTEFLELAQMLDLFREACGIDRKALQLPSQLVSAATQFTSGVLARAFPKLPQRLTPGAIRILEMRRHADTSKAQRELGYRPTNVRDSVHRAYAFFAEQNMLSPRILSKMGGKTSSSAVTSY